MERVHAVSEKPISEMSGVAVAIYKNRGHIGLLYTEEVWISPDLPVRYAIKLLHLCLQHPLVNDTDTSGCAFWVTPAIEPDQSDLISEYCQLVYERNRGNVIPYGFGPFEGAFDDSGVLSNDASQWGLTCASFVLAVFHRSGIPLINWNDWPVREDDVPDMEYLIRLLRERTDATAEHVNRQAKLVAGGQRRFRPLEVAGAASSADRPIGFNEAVRLAGLINAEFDRIAQS
jgi:hypothetical protein